MKRCAAQEATTISITTPIGAIARLAPIAALLLTSCSSSDDWKTERYRDGASGRDVVIAKRQGKQDGIELVAATKCTIPTQLSFEFFTPGNFSTEQLNGQRGIPSKISVDGRPMQSRHASFTTPDTLVIPATLPAAEGSPATDLRSVGRISIQLTTAKGATNVVIMPTDPGLNGVFSACGIDPSKAIALQAAGKDNVIHHAAPSLLQSAPKVNLQTLTAIWSCSGDLGNFGLKIDNYSYQFTDDSPWGAIGGQVSIGAAQSGVDDHPTFAVTLTGGPWQADDTPWSYSPFGSGGTIYYIDTDTGQSGQCVRS